MELIVDELVKDKFDFDIEKIANDVIKTSLEMENCPFEYEIDLTIVTNEEIHEINLATRDIDRPTDVLSFPNLDFEEPGKFDVNDDNRIDYINPETNKVVLGEIVISYEKVFEQSLEYNHSPKREFAFLIAHSCLHLCGYDHMTDPDAELMESKQNAILNSLNITRDI